MNGEPHISFSEEIMTALDDIYYAIVEGGNDTGHLMYLYHLLKDKADSEVLNGD